MLVQFYHKLIMHVNHDYHAHTCILVPGIVYILKNQFSSLFQDVARIELTSKLLNVIEFLFGQHINIFVMQ